MSVQNHFDVFASASPHDEWDGTYPGWPNAVAMLTSSSAIQEFATTATANRLPSFLVGYDIGEKFQPAAKERVVASMSRKRPRDLTAAVQLLRRSPLMQRWEFDDISGVTHEEVASRLGRAAIFMCGSDREGFGLPPAEAMASGCYVVGFTGGGGREFMLEEHCSVIADQDLLGLAGEVERTAHSWDRDRESVEHRAELGREFVRSRYNRERLVASLGQAFDELTAPGSPARQPNPSTVHHYTSLRQRWSARKVARRWLPPAVSEAVKRRGSG